MTSDSQSESGGVSLPAWWEIQHPGTLEKVKCATFNEAMDKWFEGFNIPVLVVDGVQGRESAHLMSGNGAGATPASATISWLNK